MYKNILHLYSATRYSIMGLISAFKLEQAFRQEIITLCILILILFIQEKSFLSWIIVINGWLFVMTIELLNSALEKAFDLISKEYHPLIKQGKDIASAAVFIAIVFNILIWVYIFIYN